MNQQFDIFLSHNSKDKTVIRGIKQWLLERQLSVWLDEDELQPGVNWMPLLEQAIGNCQSAGAFVSSNGIGPWEDEEIQALLTKAVHNKIPVIPVLLPGDYDAPELPLFLGNRTFIDMRLGITSELLDKLEWGITGKKPQPKIKDVGLKPDLLSDQLPTVKGRFFGRKNELALLDAAWMGNDTRIVQFTAAGGTGKTKLLRHWIDQTSDITCLVAWSFYAQGSTEDKQTSATPFFLHVLDVLKSPHSLSYFDQQPEALGRHIAALVHAQCCVLVLDGLEPLQYADKGNRGELKDRALRALVKSLMGKNDGLCIITTRIPLYEISDRDEPLVIRHTLENLHVDDGVELLKSLKVHGKPDDLTTAVRAYGCHALALNLLGALLYKRYQGDVNQHIQLKALVNSTGDRESRHAFRVMQTYADVLVGTPELKLLYLLGLFDHSIDLVVLRVLWQAQIPELTATISEDDWLDAIDAIRNEWYLLTDNLNNPELLDCHPLIREYFGGQLHTQQLEVWQQAHERLYEYYKALPEKLYEKFLPETLEEMQPLFSAVAHGCAAGLHQQVLDEVFWPRIRRKEENFICTKLGAFSDELAIIAYFFAVPWHTSVTSLSDIHKAMLLGWAGFRLRAVGRLYEALEPMRVSTDEIIKKKYWFEAAIGHTNLSELHLLLGNITIAITTARKGVELAAKSKKNFIYVTSRSILADALHQAGNIDESLNLFRIAESFQLKKDSKHYLYSLNGFRYCDLLTTSKNKTSLFVRAKHGLAFSVKSGRLLDIALDQLLISQAYLEKEDLDKGAKNLEQAISGLYQYGSVQHLPRGLLARAALYRHTHEFRPRPC